MWERCSSEGHQVCQKICSASVCGVHLHSRLPPAGVPCTRSTRVLTRLGSGGNAVAGRHIRRSRACVPRRFHHGYLELRPSVRIDRTKTGRLTKAYPKLCKRCGTRPERSNRWFRLKSQMLTRLVSPQASRDYNGSDADTPEEQKTSEQQFLNKLSFGTRVLLWM